MFVCPEPKTSQVMMKWCRRASHLGRFTLWNNGRRATQLGERFGRFIKHRSIVDLQQTLKYVRFTKIQHTFPRSTIYEDRIADLRKRLKNERRGHTNHQVSYFTLWHNRR